LPTRLLSSTNAVNDVILQSYLNVRMINNVYFHILAQEENAREEKAELQKELKAFWRDVPSVLLKQQCLHDIARKDYEVKNLLVPQNLEDPEQKVLL
jgi:hypothetical protein